jgi:hypothetical protein
MMDRPKHSEATQAIVAVSNGRGFIVQHEHNRLVITAAHCLPYLPPCHGLSYTEERTYQRLLGPLGQEPSVWAECLFADPVADIAVLGEPDRQELSDECDAYRALTEAAAPLPIANVSGGPSWRLDGDKVVAVPELVHQVWMLSLDGDWFSGEVLHYGGPLVLKGAAQDIVGGMSGSPILNDEGAAIGVVCLGENMSPHPRLAAHLPGWLLSAAGRDNRGAPQPL